MKKALARIAICALLVACDREPTPAPPSPSPLPATEASSTAPPASASAPAPSSPASAPAPSEPLQVLRLVLTSEVKKREPVDKLEAAGPGQRVWAHVAVRNRSGKPRRISLLFRVDGEERSSIDLKIEPSWSYRTWGYNTLRPRDTSGQLTVEVRDLDDGSLLADAKLPIKASTIKKPLSP